MSDPIEPLRRSYLTAGLSESQHAWLASRTQRRTVAAGDTVFEQGAPGNSLFIVEDGEVRISVESKTGQTLTLDTVYEWESFGELSLLDRALRSATATAVQDTKLVVLHRDDFMQLIHTEQTALDAVIHNLAEMVRAMNDKIRDTAGAAGKVAKDLLALADRHGETTASGGRMIVHALTFDDIASRTVLETEWVKKIMEIYQERRVIERGPEYWTILQPEVLRADVESPRYRG